jgi:DNA topoisomerase-1
MIEKQNNKGEMIHLCTNENCRFKTIAQPQEDEAE